MPNRPFLPVFQSKMQKLLAKVEPAAASAIQTAFEMLSNMDEDKAIVSLSQYLNQIANNIIHKVGENYNDDVKELMDCCLSIADRDDKLKAEINRIKTQFMAADNEKDRGDARRQLLQMLGNANFVKLLLQQIKSSKQEQAKAPFETLDTGMQENDPSDNAFLKSRETMLANLAGQASYSSEGALGARLVELLFLLLEKFAKKLGYDVVSPWITEPGEKSKGQKFMPGPGGTTMPMFSIPSA